MVENRLEIDEVIETLRVAIKPYPDVAASICVAIRQGVQAGRCIDFLLSAIEELEQSIKYSNDFRISVVAAQFSDVAVFFNTDIENGVYTEKHLVRFLVDLWLEHNQLQRKKTERTKYRVAAEQYKKARRKGRPHF